MARLRGPGGCPWDREQSFDTIRKYTLEESYEVFDAIERRNWTDLCEELGDLLLQVLFYAQMASEPGYFTIADVIAGLNRKLVRRHPHVFGDEASMAAGNAVESPLQDRRISTHPRCCATGMPSSGQRRRSRASPRSMAFRARFLRCWKPPSWGRGRTRAASTGRMLKASSPSWRKRPKSCARQSDASSARRRRPRRQVVSEVGDMLFTMVNLARRLQVEPEFALRHTNAKFRRRFAAMEAASPQPLEALSAAQLELLWSQAKLAESPAASPSR